MTTTPFQIETGRLVEQVAPEDHTRGPDAAPVTLVEYGDYQCPYCGQAVPDRTRLCWRSGPRTVRFVFRHFPLTDDPPVRRTRRGGWPKQSAHAVGVLDRRMTWLFHPSERDNRPHDDLRRAATAIDPPPRWGSAGDLRPTCLRQHASDETSSTACAAGSTGHRRSSSTVSATTADIRYRNSLARSMCEGTTGGECETEGPLSRWAPHDRHYDRLCGATFDPVP